MTKILITITFSLVLLTQTSCGGSNTPQEQTTIQNIMEQTASDDSEETENNLDSTNYISGTADELEIEEFSETIVAAGTFWEDWWALRGPFAREHIEDIEWLYWAEQPQHPLSQGFSRLLPSSGFSSLYDIESYLLQYYTEEWVYARVISENDVFDEDHATLLHLTIFANLFADYDDALYTQITHRGGNTNRPNWTAATHIIKEQEGNRTVVETIVPIRPWTESHRRQKVPRESLYQFTFIDGRIDEMLHMEDIYDTIVPPVFDDMAVPAPQMQLFAQALSDFFVDAEPSPPDGLILENDTHAILVDVDGNGTPGVIASKWTTSDNYGNNPNAQPRFVQMLFYIYEDQLNYQQIFGAVMAPAAPSRRLVKLNGADAQGLSQSIYSILGFIDGELVSVKSIIAVVYWNLPCGYGIPGENRYYVIHNPVGNIHTGEIDWEQSIPISHEEFIEIAAQHGLLSIFKSSNVLEIPSEVDILTP